MSPMQPSAKRPRQTGASPSNSSPLSANPANAGSPAPDGARRAGTVTLPLAALIALVGAAAVLLVATVVLGVRSCSLERQVDELTPKVWVCPYDWNNLMTRTNGLLAYSENGVIVSEAGVDVSEHDGAIDWVAAKAAGIDFAMIRVGYRGYGEGTLNLDDYFISNITNAKAAGVKVGAYFFSQAITEDEAREEARYVLDQLAAVGISLDYPIAFDQEPITNGDIARTDGISNAQLTANALAFCQTIEAAGYTAIVYGNPTDLGKLDLDALSDYDIWLAEYGVSTPSIQTDYIMWQYTERGTVDGFLGAPGWTDLNIRFKAAS